MIPGTHTNRFNAPTLNAAIRAMGVEPTSDVGLLMLIVGNFRLCWGDDFPDYIADRPRAAEELCCLLTDKPMISGSYANRLARSILACGVVPSSTVGIAMLAYGNLKLCLEEDLHDATDAIMQACEKLHAHLDAQPFLPRWKL